MNSLADVNHEKLRLLIEETEHGRELECREYIPFALDLFTPYTETTTTLNDIDEYPGHTGPSDLIVFGERICGGIREKNAYIWEVKSPQTNIFVKCSNNRVKPSAEFIKAENQLLHYWEDCKSEQFRKEFNLTSIDSIRLGGILIGKNENLVSGNFCDDAKKRRLYTTAINLRKKCFYERTGINFMIWDDVLNFIKPAAPITKQESGKNLLISLISNEPSKIYFNDQEYHVYGKSDLKNMKWHKKEK